MVMMVMIVLSILVLAPVEMRNKLSQYCTDHFFAILFLDRGEGKETERERNINV